jgi:hypothetical protein
MTNGKLVLALTTDEDETNLPRHRYINRSSFNRVRLRDLHL